MWEVLILKSFVTGIAFLLLQGYLVTHIDQPDDILWGGFGYSLHERYPIIISSDQLSSLSGFNRLTMSVNKMNPPLQSNKPYSPEEILRWIALTFIHCFSSQCFYNKRSCLNDIRKNLPYSSIATGSHWPDHQLAIRGADWGWWRESEIADPAPALGPGRGGW